MDAIQTASASALARLLAQQPLTPAKVTFAWHAVAGPFAQRATASVTLDADVLTVEVRDEPWAGELRAATATLIPRLNHILGAGTIGRLHVRAPGARASSPPPRSR